MQNRLISLGYLAGKADGKFGPATELALRAFQKEAGLWVDGIAGPKTLARLYASNAPKAGTATASIGISLKSGAEGQAVRALQRRLRELGYYHGSVDGSYGRETENAVMAFQLSRGLKADGVAGTSTLAALYGSSATAAPRTATPQPTTEISSTGYITLESGSSGEQVKTLQNRLKELGYYHGNVDGNFGEGTETAVMAFQQNNNLTVDGKAGPATQRVLYGSKTNITYASMRQGDEGNAVKNLQYTLYELGYYDGAIDGKYGQTTADAVRAFQIQNKITPVDGVAGSKTLGKMYSSDAVAATVADVSYDTVQSGDKGEMVVEIQDCLVQRGFLDSITGVYDDATVAAVKAFQSANGLTPDGKCGSRTLMILFGY